MIRSMPKPAALFLVEHMPPAIRVELGRLLVANGR
jgi:hypothetical protein